MSYFTPNFFLFSWFNVHTRLNVVPPSWHYSSSYHLIPPFCCIFGDTHHSSGGVWFILHTSLVFCGACTFHSTFQTFLFVCFHNYVLLSPRDPIDDMVNFGPSTIIQVALVPFHSFGDSIFCSLGSYNYRFLTFYCPFYLYWACLVPKMFWLVSCYPYLWCGVSFLHPLLVLW